MGWMRTLLLGDIGNRLDIEDTERDLAGLRRKHEHGQKKLAAKERELDVLRDEVARLKLATHALTRFLIKQGTVDADALADFIAEVDSEDRVIDGKLTIDTASQRLRFAEKVTIPEGTFKKIEG